MPRKKKSTLIEAVKKVTGRKIPRVKVVKKKATLGDLFEKVDTSGAKKKLPRAKIPVGSLAESTIARSRRRLREATTRKKTYYYKGKKSD